MRSNSIAIGGLLLLAGSLTGGPALAGDPARGEKVFKRCQACHTLEAGGATTRGPNLHGLFGREAGTAGYDKYSEAFKTSGIVWTAETLDEFLAKPKQLIPGNTMAFSRLRKEDQRADLIAYLEQATK